MRRAIALFGAVLLAGAAGAASLDPSPAAGLSSTADMAGGRAVFAALHQGQWDVAASAIDRLADPALAAVARAELILARGAPKADPVALAALLATAPDLPQAQALAMLAHAQGITALPALPALHDLKRLPGASKRAAAPAGRRDAASAALAAAVQPLLKANDAAAAEPLVEAAAPGLTPEALTEWRQRLAWAHFLGGNDVDARRVAALAATGSGEWLVQADWVGGLAAWRAHDYPAAADAFQAVASGARDAETVAAGLFWAARSDLAAGNADRAAPRLRTASRLDETFYGLLAAALIDPLAVPRRTDDIAPGSVEGHANVRAAIPLAAIGETDLADRLLRHQARIGSVSEHIGLIAVAARLGLSRTQVWLAQNGPSGTTGAITQRYPMPAWSPAGGWRVDRALLLAHALQESQLRTDAVSPAGARGLMQLMPATARLVARHKGEAPSAADRLDDPAMSFEFGQSYLEELAANAGTGGLLPKVIAAYNAGPNNVALWNLRSGVQADPLLFIESIPFGETRAYVGIVLRNYWIYQRESGAPQDSLVALAQGKWPRFPVAAIQVAQAGGGGTASAVR